MILTWGVAVAPGLVAAALLVVPGLIVSFALGARGFDALGLAPLTSLGVLAIATMMVPIVVARWSFAAVAVALVLLTLVAGVGRVVIAWRKGDLAPDPGHGHRGWTLREVTSSGLTSRGLTSRGMTSRGLTSRWWRPRRRTIWWLASAGLAAGLVTANFVLGVGDPGRPSQTIDAGFHYNAVLAVLRSGLPDGGNVGAASGAAATAWYPPLWHDLTALVSSLTGVNVVIGANAVGWAIGGVIWPLSMVWMCSRVLPRARPLTTMAVGLCCGVITLFPYLLLSFGVLWPNVLSLAALPAAIALTLMVLHLMTRSPGAQEDISSAGAAADGSSMDDIEIETEAPAVQRGLALQPVLSWWTVLSVGFLGCVGMFFAHPGALFALGIWAFVGMVILSAQLVVGSRVRGPRQLRRSLSLLLLGWSVALGLWGAMNLVPALNAVRDKNWAESMTMNQAMGQALTLSTIITKAHWALGAATLWGFYRLLKIPRLRWLLASHVALVFLYMLSAGSPGWLARELTGFWYNDAQRVAALIPMTAVPLAALGLTSAADVLARVVGRSSSDVLGRRLSARRTLGFAGPGMLVVAAVIQPGHGLGQAVPVLQDRYDNQSFSHHLVTGDEQALYEALATQIPAGETVLGSPFTGAQFSGIWSGHEVVIPHTSSNPSPDVRLVSTRIKSFTTDPVVCSAVKRLKVGAVVDDVDRYQGTAERELDYAGLVDLENTPGLTPIDRGVSAVIYRVGDCAS